MKGQEERQAQYTSYYKHIEIFELSNDKLEVSGIVQRISQATFKLAMRSLK
jgi:hypothetical protein